MKVSRRNLLKMAAASAALAGQPAGGALGAATGIAEASAAGPLFAVVSPGKAWAVCNSYHEAYHHAGMIRHSGGVCTSHVRCTTAFAEQLKSGSLKSFVEIDGWAVTSSEAEARGFDFLRDAVDRMRARHQLVTHYRSVALAKVNASDRKRVDALRYVAAHFDDGGPSRIISVAGSEQDALEAADRRLHGAPDAEPRLVVQPCSPDLGGQLQAWLEEGGQAPCILKQTGLHMTAEEHAERLDDDPLFRFAVLGPTSHSALGDRTPRFIAYDRADNWIYGAGESEETALESARWASCYADGQDFLTSRASARLANAVAAQGLELPAMWKRVGRVARHESEILKPQTSRTTRRAIRPPLPEWKRR